MSFINDINWVFKQDTPTEFIEEISLLIRNWRPEGIEIFLSGHHCYFDRMDQSQILKVYKWLKSWKVYQFRNNQKLNHHTYLLKQIAHIQFSHLKTLCFFESKITNIEALTFLDCPALQEMALTNNYIAEFKCLSKMNFPKLKNLVLDIYPAPCNYQFAFIGRVKFHSQAEYVMIHNAQDEERFHINQMVKSEPVINNYSNVVLASFYKLHEILPVLYPNKFNPKNIE